MQTVLVPVNWRLTAPEVSHILQDSDTRLLFLEDEFTSIVAAMPTDAPETVVRLSSLLEWRTEHRDTETEFDPTPVTPVAQLYRSGTTGLPKGVVLAHRSYFAIRDALASQGLDWIDWREGDITLIGIPASTSADCGGPPRTSTRAPRSWRCALSPPARPSTSSATSALPPPAWSPPCSA